MKKIFYLLLIIFLFYCQCVNGQTKTASVSATKTPSVTSIDESAVQELKDKIATKVAEMRQKNNKALSGRVIDIIDNIIKIKSRDESIYEIKIDDALTKFYQIAGSQKKEIKQGDIKKNDYILVAGVISDKKVTANTIYQDEMFIVKSGKITEVNSDDYYIKVITTDKDNYTLDIETYTKKSILNIKTLELDNVGFTKIKEGDTIQFVVKKTGLEKEANRYSVQKLLLIPQEFFIK